MEAFATYLLKSSIWLSGFTLVYFLFLRNERFFMLKRIYLVSGILISFLFPLFTIHYQVVVPDPAISPADIMHSGNQAVTGTFQAGTESLINYRFILLSLYLSGVLFLAFRLIMQIGSLYKIINGATINKRGEAKLIRASEFSSSFSFINYVFINPSVSETEVEEIMNHEIVHVRQKHWFDLLLIEVIRLFQWVNPFAWIYTGFIKLNHEYLADEMALQRTSNPAIYKAALVNQLFSSPVINLSNSFNYSLNKKRFDMMKKIISSPYRKLKVLFILPVFAIVFYAFAEPEYNYSAPAGNTMINYQAPAIIAKDVKGVVLKEDGTPFAGVPILVTGTTIRSTTDESGNFTLTGVPEDALIVFSYKGYLTQVLKAEFNKEMSVKLMRDPDYKEVTVISYGDGTPGPLTIRSGNMTAGPAPKPLIVIDGVISNNGVDEINPNEINSISVLKDKSATAVFGEKGKDGVIIVTLKKQDPAIIQKIVNGIVLKEDEKPLQGVNITSTGTMGNAYGATSGPDGQFEINDVQADASLLFFCQGYKRQTLKAVFGSEMTVKMVIDPEYKTQTPRPEPIAIVDGVISEKSYTEVSKELGYNLGIIKVLSLKESAEKYGEKGKNGVVEITTRKKALEMGLKPPFRRMKPEDSPTFQGNRISSFDQWLVGQIKYPTEAAAKGAQGRVYVNFTVELDGSLSNIKLVNSPDPVLSDAVLKAVGSSPKWDPPKNAAVDEAYQYNIAVKFTLPDNVSDGKAYVVVEEMPRYPGGESELLNFITVNTQYPEEAKTQLIQGKVIVRFIVNTEGKPEDVMVLKAVHPLLDAEAIRVVSKLSGFRPGYQGGNPVNVYYMVPITFSLTK
jgi:TonB family protein